MIINCENLKTYYSGIPIIYLMIMIEINYKRSL